MLRRCVTNFLRTSQPKVLYSRQKIENPTPLVLKLMAEFDNVSSITSALKNKALINIHFDDWKSRISVLKRYNFSDDDCFKMISTYPHLLKIPLQNFENSVKQWFFVEFSVENFQFLLLTQPILIQVDPKEIKKRVPQLRIYCKSSEILCKMLVVSPNVMLDNWESVSEKIHFLVKQYKFNTGDIIRSCALSKSLSFIKFRIDLLEKCGLYKLDNIPIHKLNKYDKTKHKNPTLEAILKPKIKDFAKTAKISHEEYFVYRNLFLEQGKEEEEEEEEEDFRSSFNN